MSEQQQQQLNTIEQKLVRQFEFYFSDSNLPNDHFLRGLFDADPEHWVELAQLCAFNRVKQITENAQVVLEALRKAIASGASTLLRVSEDGTRITRTTPLPDRVDVSKCAVMARGFPTTYTLDDVQDFFAKHMPGGAAHVKCVRLQRSKEDKSFTGACFVELSSPELAAQIAALEKIELQPATTNEDGSVATEAVMIEVAPKKESKDGNNKKAAAEGSSKKRRADTSTGDLEADAKADAAQTKSELPLIPNLLIKFDTVGSTTTRESLKEFVEKLGGKVVYTDFSKGETEAVVRLDETSPLNATACIAKAQEAAAQIDDVVPSLRALEGEEESAYWAALNQRRADQAKNASSSRGGRSGGRGGRGGRGGGRGGRGGGRGGRGGGNKRGRSE